MRGGEMRSVAVHAHTNNARDRKAGPRVEATVSCKRMGWLRRRAHVPPFHLLFILLLFTPLLLILLLSLLLLPLLLLHSIPVQCDAVRCGAGRCN